MTSDPPNSPENQNPGLPPRHRRSLESLQNESQEGHLWDLDDDELSTNPGTANQADTPDGLEKQTRKPNIPEIKKRRDPARDSPAPNESQTESTRQPYGEHPTARVSNRQTPADADFDDLDSFKDSERPPSTPQSDAQNPPTPPPESTPPQVAPVTAESPLLQSAHAKKTSENRRKKIFSPKEKIALLSVSALLVLGIAFFIFNAFKGLPRLTDPYAMPDFPARGEHISIDQVNTYWRIPITSGPNADTVQRGTELMPILEINATAENAAIRVQFRNSEGTTVGDPVTRTIQGESELVIPSTAGLEDLNIHNAYRTGILDPWTAEILEAPAGTTAGSAFRPIIRIPISPHRR